MGKKYPCEECDFQATQKINLTTHQQSVHMGKKYPCKECDYKATTKGSLTTHQQSVHIGKKYPKDNIQESDLQIILALLGSLVITFFTWIFLTHVD